MNVTTVRILLILSKRSSWFCAFLQRIKASPGEGARTRRELLRGERRARSVVRVPCCVDPLRGSAGTPSGKSPRPRGTGCPPRRGSPQSRLGHCVLKCQRAFSAGRLS